MSSAEARALNQIYKYGQHNCARSDVKRQVGTSMPTTDAGVIRLASLLPEECDMDRSSAIGFWRAGRSEISSLTAGDATHLTLMNVTHSVTTGSGSAVDKNVAFLCCDSHAPAGINDLDVTPCHKVITQGIKHSDSLAIESDLGFNKAGVISCANSARHQNASKNIFATALSDTCPHISSSENFNDYRDRQVASSAEAFRLTRATSSAPSPVMHSSIFPQVSEVLS
jgi:hypothetical protein